MQDIKIIINLSIETKYCRQLILKQQTGFARLQFDLDIKYEVYC